MVSISERLDCLHPHCWVTSTDLVNQNLFVYFYLCILSLTPLYLLRSLLSQYRFCVGGVGVGAAYGMKYPTGRFGRYVPFVIGGVAGTIADVAYGYTVACVKEVEAHRAQREEKLRNITGQS